MNNKLKLKDSEQAHKAIVTSQENKIVKLYEKWANEIAEQAKQYQYAKNPSSVLKAQQLIELETSLRKSSERVANEAMKAIKQNMMQASQSVVTSSTEFMKKLGFPEDGISAAFSSVPTDIVQNIITGQIYESGWSLSKSIWSDNEDTLKKAYEMVAGGIAENKSIYEISKDLEDFVSPTAKKPWNYTFKAENKVTGETQTYRVYPKKVDYNAQRLARTLSQHAYEQTIVSVNKKNPFVQKIRWHSTGSRACPICKERDGKLFDKDKVPMDHPNGMCVLEPVYDENTNDRLAAWVNGKDDPAIDAYVKQFGFTSGDADTSKLESAEPVNKTKIVQGDPNAVSTWKRRKDKFDFEIEDIINYQGFDGLPRLVDADEFDRIAKQSNFIAQRTYSASTKEILDSYRDQLYHGKWYVDCSVNGADQGQGMYCAGDYSSKLTSAIKTEMKYYQDYNKTKNKNDLSYTETLTLDPSAKRIDYITIYQEFVDQKRNMRIRNEEEFLRKQIESKFADNPEKQADILKLAKSSTGISRDYVSEYEIFNPSMPGAREMYQKYSSIMSEYSTKDYNGEFEGGGEIFEDVGSYAAARGYDAIVAEGRGVEGCVYTVVLNRTKLVIKKG